MVNRKYILAAAVIGCVVIWLKVLPLLTQSREERLARALAKTEVSKRGWMLSMVTNVRHESNRWIIYIERFPREFGGNAFVDVENGKVVKYRGGK